MEFERPHARILRANPGWGLGAFRDLPVPAGSGLAQSESQIHRSHRRRLSRSADQRGRRLLVAHLAGHRRLRSGAARAASFGRGERTEAGLRRRHGIDLSGGHVRRRTDRPGSHSQRRGVLLAESRLRPLRREGHDGPAPRFERRDLFDGRRIRLADIDGSGTTDIIYFASGAVHLYFNQSGNGWGAGAS